MECKQSEVENYAPGIYITMNSSEERVADLQRGVLHGSDWYEPDGNGDMAPSRLLYAVTVHTAGHCADHEDICRCSETAILKVEAAARGDRIRFIAGVAGHPTRE